MLGLGLGLGQGQNLSLALTLVTERNGRKCLSSIPCTRSACLARSCTWSGSGFGFGLVSPEPEPEPEPDLSPNPNGERRAVLYLADEAGDGGEIDRRRRELLC